VASSDLTVCVARRRADQLRAPQPEHAHRSRAWRPPLPSGPQPRLPISPPSRGRGLATSARSRTGSTGTCSTAWPPPDPTPRSS
jgi:hypothetical protein